MLRGTIGLSLLFNHPDLFSWFGSGPQTGIVAVLTDQSWGVLRLLRNHGSNPKAVRRGLMLPGIHECRTAATPLPRQIDCSIDHFADLKTYFSAMPVSAKLLLIGFCR